MNKKDNKKELAEQLAAMKEATSAGKTKQQSPTLLKEAVMEDYLNREAFS